MNTSLRYTALALLLAFAGSQVCAMTNEANPVIVTQAEYSAMRNVIVDAFVTLLSGSKVEAVAAVNALEGQGYIAKAFEQKDKIVKFSQEFLTKNPNFLKYSGIVALTGTIGSALYLVAKKTNAFVKLWEGTKALAAKAQENPRVSVPAGFAALTVIGLAVAQQKGYISPIHATIGTFLANNELFQYMYNKLPNMATVKGLFNFRNTAALGAAGIGAAAVKTVFGANKAKKALPAAPVKPAQAPVKQVAQAPAKPAQAPVKQVVQPAPKQTAPAQKQTQAPAQSRGWFGFGRNNKQQEATAQQQAVVQAQETVQKQAAETLVNANKKQQLINTLQDELNRKVDVGTAQALAKANFPASLNLVADCEKAITKALTAGDRGTIQKYTALAQSSINNVQNQLN